MNTRFLMNAAPAILDPVRGPERAVIVLLSLISGLLFFLLVWAAFAHIDVTAKGEGSVCRRATSRSCRTWRAVYCARCWCARAIV